MREFEAIRRIQHEYAALLDSQMGDLGRQFDEALANDPMHSVANNPEVLHEFVKEYIVGELKASPGSPLSLPRRLTKLNQPRLFLQVEDLLLGVSSFWDTNYAVLSDAMRQSNSKALMTQIGDLDGIGSYYAECSTRLGLYVDSTCLVDPLSVVADRISVGDLDKGELAAPSRLYAVIKNYLSLRYLAPLLTANTELPIAIIFPSRRIKWAGNEFHSLKNLAELTTSAIFSDLFQTDYSQMVDALDDVGRLPLDELEVLVKRSALVSEFLARHQCKSLKDLDSLSPPTEQSNYLEKVANESIVYFGKLFGGLEGQFLALNGAEVLAHDLGIDIARPREHWEPNKHRMTCDSRLAMTRLPEQAVVHCAVLSERTEFLLAATMTDLRRWREEGILEGVRELYRVDRKEMQDCTPETLQSTVDSLVTEVSERITSEVARLRVAKWFEQQERERSGVKLAATVGFGIASNLFTQPIGWLLALASTVVPTDTIPQFLAQRFESDKTLSGKSQSPAFHMHDLMNQAAMIKAIEGRLPPRLE